MDEQADDFAASVDNRQQILLQLLISRQRLFRTVVLAVPLVFLVVTLSLPLYGVLRRYEEILSAEVAGMKRIPELDQRIAKMQGDIDVLTSKSVETRLSTIEQAIKAGSLKPDEIASVQQLRADVDMLQSYLSQDPKRVVELRQLLDSYQATRQAVDAAVTQREFAAEISHLTSMLYLSLAFFGILFTVLFGSWWFVGRRAPASIEQPTQPVVPGNSGQ